MKEKSTIRFLIMETLPSNGLHMTVDDLERNVSLDAQTLNVCFSKGVFDYTLKQLVKEQYVVNLSGKIIATQMGIRRSNKSYN